MCVCVHTRGLGNVHGGCRINSFYSDLVSAYIVGSYPHLGYFASGVPSLPCPLSDSDHFLLEPKKNKAKKKKKKRIIKGTLLTLCRKRLLFAQKAIGRAIYLAIFLPFNEAEAQLERTTESPGMLAPHTQRPSPGQPGPSSGAHRH